MKNCRLVAAALLACAASVASAAVPFRIDGASVPKIVAEKGMRPFVLKAAGDVAGDMEKIFGARPEIAASGAPPPANAIVLAKGGSGWENYAVESLPGNVLKITGSDDRGVMFGLYRFASDCLGVDPFYWWSGREPAKAASREWKSIDIRQGDPSFKFRGWFINDEDFLNGLRPDENGKRQINYPRYHVCFGVNLAEKIYETAVRAGFNTMVCASYVDILNPDEKRLVDIASSRGLFITMHHQEPVGAGALQLDLHFPEIRETTYASHPDLWRKAWKRYVEEWAKVPDVIWQLGLRGRRDTPFWKIAGYEVDEKITEEEDRRRASYITRAMAEQLDMITAALGRSPEHYATQLWMEGAELYRRGLVSMPEGTIIIFSDNCPGLKFQSDIGGVERLPQGGRYGLYYHLALVHGNHRCELVPPLRTHQILQDAWRKGARDFVLFNVSNVRPFLYTIEGAGKISRDVENFDPVGYQIRWTEARFGKRAQAVRRAINQYFSAYETEYSRDTLSSYGSPRERAPLAILNDGMVTRALRSQVERFAAHDRRPAKPTVSQYLKDPDALVSLKESILSRVNQDQNSSLADKMRTPIRAAAQTAAFRRCLEQIDRASEGMDERARHQLFERFGYPAEFMALSSAAFTEMAMALDDMDLKDDRRSLEHAERALELLEERERLDTRYASGRWEHWYDRDLIYPCRTVAEALRKALRKRKEQEK